MKKRKMRSDDDLWALFHFKEHQIEMNYVSNFEKLTFLDTKTHKRPCAIKKDKPRHIKKPGKFKSYNPAIRGDMKSFQQYILGGIL